MSEQLDTGPETYVRRFEQWLELVEGPNRDAIARFTADDDNRRKVEIAPGSRSAHHAWPGGYREHLRQTFMIASHTFDLLVATGRMAELPEVQQFSLSDALTVMYLHDIEKPFIYEFDEQGEIQTLVRMTKQDRKEFRRDIVEKYGFYLTPTMVNALKYVEGERDADYVPGGRAEEPLASLCQVADNLSARGFYDHGRPQ